MNRRVRNRTHGGVRGRENLFNFPSYSIDYDDDYVCTRILFDEALHRTGEMKQWEGKEIANIMNNAIVGWKPHGTHRFGKEYGIQRSWKRMEESVKKDKDGFVEVPEQLEIPFE